MASTASLTNGFRRKRNSGRCSWKRCKESCKKVLTNFWKPSLFPQASFTTSTTCLRCTVTWAKSRRCTWMRKDWAECWRLSCLKVRRLGSITMMRWPSCWWSWGGSLKTGSFFRWVQSWRKCSERGTCCRQEWEVSKMYQAQTKESSTSHKSLLIETRTKKKLTWNGWWTKSLKTKSKKRAEQELGAVDH